MAALVFTKCYWTATDWLSVSDQQQDNSFPLIQIRPAKDSVVVRRIFVIVGDYLHTEWPVRVHCWNTLCR